MLPTTQTYEEDFIAQAERLIAQAERSKNAAQKEIYWGIALILGSPFFGAIMVIGILLLTPVSLGLSLGIALPACLLFVTFFMGGLGLCSSGIDRGSAAKKTIKTLRNRPPTSTFVVFPITPETIDALRNRSSDLVSTPVMVAYPAPAKSEATQTGAIPTTEVQNDPP